MNTEEIIEKEITVVVEEKESNYEQVVANTEEQSTQEKDVIVNAEEEVLGLDKDITNLQTEIESTEMETSESIDQAILMDKELADRVETAYTAMEVADDLSFEWSDSHTMKEVQEVLDGGETQLNQIQIELTRICDCAKEDYATLKTAVEKYGQDYDEEAYQKAIEGITIPVINVAETNTAVDNLITKLQEYPDTTEWQNALVEYKQSVEELNALNLEAMFNDLYATKDKYDEMKSMKAELEAKKEELATKKAELDQMYEDLKANDAIRAEQVAQAKAELDKAMEVQENVLAGIYEKVDDPAYAEYNKSIDAYYSSLVETPKDEEQTSPKEEEAVVVIPNLDESEILKEVTTENLVVYQEVQKVTQDVPTASYSGLTGYVMSALMSLVCVVCVAKKHIMK